VYTLGVWTVKNGREGDVVKAWEDWADRTRPRQDDEEEMS
jgi:hypothetical protein